MEITTKAEMLKTLGKLKGLNVPQAHNTALMVDYDMKCEGCGNTLNTKCGLLQYLAVALPARHFFQCPCSHITCIKQGFFTSKIEFSFAHKFLNELNNFLPLK